jgi:F-type H+-transporting ATPase subunit b
MRWLSIGVLTVVLALGASGVSFAAQHAHPGEDVSPAVMSPAEFRTDLAVFSLVVFGLLFALLYAKAWPKISSALEEREAGIRRAIADAEKARIDSAEMLKQHQAKLDAVQEEVKTILAEARRDAERAKNDIVAAAGTEATAIKNRAIADIDRAKDQALEEVFGKLADQVAAATAQVVGRSLTADDQNRLIREALTQVSPN